MGRKNHRGDKAIVVHMDGSVMAMEISGYKEDKAKTGPIIEEHEGKLVDIFSKEALPEDAKILLPTKP